MVAILCYKTCRKSRMMTSSASVKNARLTEESVLRDLLMKLDAHAKEYPGCIASAAAPPEQPRQRAPSHAVEAARAGDKGQSAADAEERTASLRLSAVQNQRHAIAYAKGKLETIESQLAELRRSIAEQEWELQREHDTLSYDIKVMEEDLSAMTCDSKRQRLAPAVSASAPPGAPAADDDYRNSKPYLTWTLAKFRELESELHARRRVPLSDTAMPPRESRPRGENGPLGHWRRSVVHAVQDWAEGSEEYAAHIIYATAKHFGKPLMDKVSEMLHVDLDDDRIDREVKIKCYIADRYKEAISVLKPCSSEAQRQQYLIPPRPRVWCMPCPGGTGSHRHDTSYSMIYDDISNILH